MNTRNIAIFGVSILLLGVCALCGLTVFGSYQWLQANDSHLRLFSSETVSAEVIETKSFSLQQPLALEVYTDIGDIQVSAQPGDQTVVQIVKKGWGATTAEAKTAAKQLPVNLQQEANRLRIETIPSSDSKIVLFGSSHPSSVSFKIQVPAQADLILKTAHGNLELNGTRGKASLESRFGQVKVTNLSGALSVLSTNGDLSIKNVQAGSEAIGLENSFGNLEVEDLSGQTVTLKTANSGIKVSQVKAAGAIIIENQFGDIEVGDLQAASMKVSNQNGAIQLKQGLLTGSLEAGTNFGEVRVEQVKANGYRLQTQNGDLWLNGAHGRLELQNQFGDIRVENADQAILALKNQNGKVSFSGSLDEASSHQVETNFGDIYLAIPAQSALDLKMETSLGRKIESELPVTIAGKMSETSWKGSLNGGGPLLAATTQNGDIILQALTTQK